MRINLSFTVKGKVAIDNFTNDELIEIFTRYTNTLTKKYAIDVLIPVDSNQSISAEGAVQVVLDNVKCDIDVFFRELGRDLKVPLKKRLSGTLDNVFKVVKIA